MALLHVSLPSARLMAGDILYSQAPQVLDPLTNPLFGGPCGLPAYTLLQWQMYITAWPEPSFVWGEGEGCDRVDFSGGGHRGQPG